MITVRKRQQRGKVRKPVWELIRNVLKDHLKTQRYQNVAVATKMYCIVRSSVYFLEYK